MRRLPWITLLLAVVASGGCVRDGLAFRLDDRLSITAPVDRAEVTLPVTLRWEMEGHVGQFAVFLDRAPMPPGEDLAWLARGDEGCRSVPGCPDATYLERLNAYVTDDTELVINQLSSRDEPGRRERHTATIVLLDETGRRTGESAFRVVFDLKRDGQP